MNISRQRDLIVVVGMHRSGTSAVTRGLATLGCALGDTLIEAIPGVNDKGFWEDVDINTFNQQLLEEHDSDWYRCVAFPADYFQAPPLRERRQKARKLLIRKLRQGKPLALKEPRLTLLLPFWQSVFSDLGLDVGYVHVLRHPLEVAQSLLVRDGFTLARSLLLWWFYNVAALRYTQEHSHVVVHYGDFMENPGCQLQRIAETLHLSPWDPDRPDSREYLETFLDPALRHAQLSDDALDGTLPEAMSALYQALRALARDEEADRLFVEGVVEGFTDETSLHQALIEELEEQFTQIHEAVQEYDRQCSELRQTLVDLEGQKRDLEQRQQSLEQKHREAVQEYDRQCSELRQTLVDLEGQKRDLEQRQQSLEQKHRLELEDLQRSRDAVVAHRDLLQQELTTMLASRSWRITLPMRRGRMALTMVLRQSLRIISVPVRWVWRRLPLSLQTRAQIRAHLLPSTRLSINTTMEQTPPTPVRCRDQALPLPTAVRMIAFHLPQYHEIPENNQWWGKGFTEWSNVQPAEPLFPGHYQPHVPLNGYYDLTDPTVLPRQAEQARRYGIEGFCFYFYWFHGHRLLEKPLQMLLEHPEWEIAYCLCWANENWTRRWDGLEQDVLIAQDYSAEDDHAFIAYLEQYLRDPRYIRIEGRPLLLLYRPDLLPDAAASVSRWREHCRASGIGEIYVAYPQSFENRDPRDYGMDAAVEFPPNNSAPPECSAVDLGCGPEFQGHIYDWSIFPQRAAHYSKPPYTLFRGLNPGWDNTPRRKQRATIFVNFDPVSYQSWAKAACDDTIERIASPQERVVFINAWNEWGEGAHLEPDVRTGCAYLEATHLAQIRSAVHKSVLPRKSGRVALVIHAFYPDVLREMVPYLRELSECLVDLWVTTPENLYSEVRSLLDPVGLTLTIVSTPNRGRDVLPFLNILPQLMARDYGYVLKLHTKKSLHRSDGDSWRDTFYRKLLNRENIDDWRKRMELDQSIGMIAPQEYIVPMSLFWGSNARQSLILAQRMGVSQEALNVIHFVAGTMFFCRWETLLPLWALSLRAEDFEEECGQVDGTLAHSVERAFGMACHVLGYQIMGV